MWKKKVVVNFWDYLKVKVNKSKANLVLLLKIQKNKIYKNK